MIEVSGKVDSVRSGTSSLKMTLEVYLSLL